MTQNTAVATAERTDLAVAKSIGSSDITGGASRTAFVATSMGEAMEIAKLMANSNFVPKHLRGKPGDCLAVVMQSARWAMDPFAVGNKTYFVNDRMAYEAQLVDAVVNSSNVLNGRLKVQWFGEGNNLECEVTGYVKGDPDPMTRRVRLNTITTRNSPLWKQDPEQQLAYFAKRAWARLFTPEVLLGVYTPDEMESVAADGRYGGDEPVRLSSDMLAQQAGVTVEQVQDAQAEPTEQVQDAEVEEIAGDGSGEARPEASDQMREAEGVSGLSEAAQQTLDEIDGPLDDEQDDDGPDPREAKAAEILEALDKCANIVDLRAHWGRNEKTVIAMPEEIEQRIRAAFKDKEAALKEPTQ